MTSNGEITVSSYNIETGERQVVVMNGESFETDDHNAGVLLLRPDGKYLTVYAGHGDEPKMRYRISANPGDMSQWEPERIAETGGNTSYSNVYRLANTGKTYNFHRGIRNNPNYMTSNDDGNSWNYGGQLFAFRGRPYLRYASNNKDRIHFITTEEHPRHYNNSIYHGYIQDGYVKKSDGSHLSRLSNNEKTDLKPQDFTPVFDGNSDTRDKVAWTSDIELDKDDNPYIAFSVTQDPISLGETANTEDGGFDNRYHYARWDGERWNEYEIAYAGTRLYAGENEYTGLITLHPDDPNVVYISTNVNPETGNSFIGGGKNHEIFRGTTADGGASWNWIPITKNSAEDNIRPIVVSNDKYEGVLWLNGRYTTYKNYDLKVLGIINEK
ncbi:BNR-4 repeat-containing protein [Autumnicola edwardsiae]|uniref:BNR-4 repeat-containing protein n=1 Tax=Autumnicola edwardsiae TaxID=3075594 RepID=A0ABU3CWA3_9FLAO|nr:BNR-4 repeat-containing protein [Zunongwangia sp. F297]MDT0650644.1 BNR-4 repeat-containing protein [Zunongwangia sp. F297]